jgi:hypothetical protein
LTHKEELKFYSGPLAATFRQTSMTPHIRAVGEPSRTDQTKGQAFNASAKHAAQCRQNLALYVVTLLSEILKQS